MMNVNGLGLSDGRIWQFLTGKENEWQKVKGRIPLMS